jgi:hypothetical protein
MTTRTDISFDFATSPRIAEVAEASDELIMQDYVDTVRPAEDDFQAMSYPHLIDASGKEDLGGGVLVAITASEQNMTLAFESNFVAAQIGTITTASDPAVRNTIRLYDTGATFITNGVQRGSFIINYTDQSVCDVWRVISETELQTRPLNNGSDNSFDVSDDYQVFNIVQKRTSGGNLVAVDENDVTIPAILPTAFTQVVQATSSSATLINATAMQEQVADIHGQVRRSIYIDTSLVANGDGYQQSPYNNFTDAVDDAEAANISRLVLLADATVDRQMRNFIVTGVGSPALDINGQDVGQSEFIGIELDGTIGGVQPIKATNCIIRNNVTGLNGRFEYCGFKGDLSLLPSNITVMIDCYSAIGGLGRPSVDTGGSGTDVSIRSYRGGLTISGTDDASDAVTVSMAQGKLTLDASNTLGNISVRGLAQFTDNSAGSTVDTTGLLNRAIVENDVWDALISDHAVTGSFGEFIVRRLLTVAKFFSLRT